MNGATCFTLEWRTDTVVLGWVHGRSRLQLRDFEIVPRVSGETGDQREFVERLRGFVRRQRGGGPDHVVLGVSRSDAIVQYIEVPATAASNLQELMRFELERHLPISPADAYTDFQPLLERNGEILTFAVAVRKTLLDEILGLLNEAGISPSVIDLAASGLQRFWLTASDGTEPAILINLEHRRADISVSHGRRLLACHEARFDPDDLWPAIERELERLLLVVRSTLGTPPIRQAVVHGPRVLRERVQSHLEQRYPGQVVSNLGPTKIHDAARRRPDYDPGMLQTAVGLAARATDAKEPGCNLLPAEKRKKPSRLGVLSTFALLVIVLVLGGGLVASWAVQQRRTLAELDRQVKELRREVFEVRDLENDLEEQETILRHFEAEKDAGLSKLELIHQLTVTIPSTAYIERIQYKGGRIELSGLADAASNLIPTLEALPIFEDVVFTAPITSRGSKERFQIRLDLER